MCGKGLCYLLWEMPAALIIRLNFPKGDVHEGHRQTGLDVKTRSLLGGSVYLIEVHHCQWNGGENVFTLLHSLEQKVHSLTDTQSSMPPCPCLCLNYLST